MRKSILSSAFALATAAAQADESRDMVLAANEYSGSRRKRPAASFQEAGLPPRETDEKARRIAGKQGAYDGRKHSKISSTPLSAAGIIVRP